MKKQKEQSCRIANCMDNYWRTENVVLVDNCNGQIIRNELVSIMMD